MLKRRGLPVWPFVRGTTSAQISQEGKTVAESFIIMRDAQGTTISAHKRPLPHDVMADTPSRTLEMHPNRGEQAVWVFFTCPHNSGDLCFLCKE